MEPAGSGRAALTIGTKIFAGTALIEFTEIRLAVEPEAAALAAKAAGAVEKATIRHAINRMIAAERGEDDPLESDIAFHVSVMQASGNKFYAQLRELTATALRFSIRMTNRYKGVRLASVADHRKLPTPSSPADPWRRRTPCVH